MGQFDNAVLSTARLSNVVVKCDPTTRGQRRSCDPDGPAINERIDPRPLRCMNIVEVLCELDIRHFDIINIIYSIRYAVFDQIMVSGTLLKDVAREPVHLDKTFVANHHFPFGVVHADANRKVFDRCLEVQRLIVELYPQRSIGGLTGLQGAQDDRRRYRCTVITAPGSKRVRCRVGGICDERGRAVQQINHSVNFLIITLQWLDYVDPNKLT